MSPTASSRMIRFVVLLTVAATAVRTQTVPAATTSRTTTLKCENGGISNGLKCTCPEFTEGIRCQDIKYRIVIGKDYNATVGVTLTMDYTYHTELKNESSENYQDFLRQYNGMMASLLRGFTASNVVKELGDKTPLIVKSEITLTFLYDNKLTVEEQYQDAVNTLKERCSPTNLCNAINIATTLPLSKEVRCGNKISPAFVQFFNPVVDNDDGLACLSHCDPNSPKFVNCSPGNCQLKGPEGPQCFCPDTDTYLYTNPRCQGRVLIVAMYGGVGGAIALLVIIGVVLGVFLYRKKHYSSL